MTPGSHIAPLLWVLVIPLAMQIPGNAPGMVEENDPSIWTLSMNMGHQEGFSLGQLFEDERFSLFCSLILSNK